MIDSEIKTLILNLLPCNTINKELQLSKKMSMFMVCAYICFVFSYPTSLFPPSSRKTQCPSMSYVRHLSFLSTVVSDI